MSEFNVEVSAGSSVRLLTAGKYCPEDIIVSSPEVTIPDAYRFVKIASDFECARAVKTIDITSYDWWESVKLENIYCVTKCVKSTTSGTFSSGASCSILISYSDGVISLNRDAISGSLVISFIMDVYIALPM